MIYIKKSITFLIDHHTPLNLAIIQKSVYFNKLRSCNIFLPDWPSYSAQLGGYLT